MIKHLKLLDLQERLRIYRILRFHLLFTKGLCFSAVIHSRKSVQGTLNRQKKKKKSLQKVASLLRRFEVHTFEIK